MSETSPYSKIESPDLGSYNEQKTIDHLWKEEGNQSLIDRGYSDYFDFLNYGPEESDHFDGISKKEFDSMLAEGSVLDAACGKGKFVSDCLDKGYDAYGVDLALSKKGVIDRVYQANPRIIGHVVAGDTRRLPFKDNTFKSAFNVFGAPSYVLDPAMAEVIIDEQMRVLKKGGKIVILPVSFIDGVPYPANHTLKLGGKELNPDEKKMCQEVEMSFAKKLLTLSDEGKVSVIPHRGDEYTYGGHTHSSGYIIIEKLEENIG